jgi:predicted metal-dependent phosphoesterase TrpH
MKKRTTLLLFLTIGILRAQTPHTHSHKRTFHFPDIAGYKTLVCDLHTHSIFSDGTVHPDIRIQEAVRDSLDAISLTEHLEYQPHKEDIPHPDRNRAHELGLKASKSTNLILIKGSEITRRQPPGHNNAIFIQDANKLLIADSIEVFREANRQGAFVFWNHPNWINQRKDGIATLTEMHKQLIKDKLLHGIEVVNDKTYSDEALQIALDYNLTIMGTSDIHGLIDWEFKIPEGGHRPVTLVFAKERTAAGIKEGLQNRRTVAWYNNTLVGRAEHLNPLIKAAIRFEKASYIGSSSVAEVTLKNDSDCEFILLNKSTFTLHQTTDVVVLPPNETTVIQVKTLNQLAVLNGVTAPQTHPELTWAVKMD